MFCLVVAFLFVHKRLCLCWFIAGLWHVRKLPNQLSYNSWMPWCWVWFDGCREAIWKLGAQLVAVHHHACLNNVCSAAQAYACSILWVAQDAYMSCSIIYLTSCTAESAAPLLHKFPSYTLPNGCLPMHPTVSWWGEQKVCSRFICKPGSETIMLEKSSICSG